MAMTSSDMLGDLIPEILSRLPVKSLLRFRCVSKSWYALISDPNFIDLHLRNRTSAINNGYILVKFPSLDNTGADILSLHCEETCIEHKRLELPFNRQPFEQFDVVGYCNGLLCLCLYGMTDYMTDIYLWNPSIKRFKALPGSPGSLKRCRTLVYLFHTFSFVPQINDYRVIQFAYHVYRGASSLIFPPKVEVYSLRLNSWKVIQNVVPCQIPRSSRYTFLNGVSHWVAKMKMEKNHDYEVILTFDMVNDVFGEMKLPEGCQDAGVVDMTPMVLNKSLCLFVSYAEGKNRHVDIWVMKEYGATESWTKQFTFDQLVRFVPPLGFMKNGEVVLAGGGEELYSYDPRVKQVKKLRTCATSYLWDLSTYYIESLVFLNEGN